MKTVYYLFKRQLPNLLTIFFLYGLLIYGAQCPLDALSDYSFIFLIGTYSLGTDSEGIYSLTLNTESGLFSPPELVAESDNPSFLLYQANSKTLYAVNELEAGAISVFKNHGKQFTLAQQLDVQGKHPCHLDLVNEDKHLGVANYSSGNISLFRRDKDRLDETSLMTVSHYGAGVNAERQEAPHAHWIGTVGNEYIYSIDLGADKIFKSKIDKKGQLSNLETAIQLSPGDGPRHIERHPVKNIIYLVNELSNSLAVLAIQDDGNFVEQQRIDLLPADNHAHSQAAAVKLDKTANYLYVTNRGHNSITTYTVLENGQLQMLSNVPSQGLWPRALFVTDDNQFLLVANEHSSAINLFRIDSKTGEPVATDEVAAISSPTSIISFA